MLIKDEILGLKIDPYSGGHDAWGFRNLFVPKQVDVVVIGDSFTYGQVKDRDLLNFCYP